jgi:hypothetical protein
VLDEYGGIRAPIPAAICAYTCASLHDLFHFIGTVGFDSVEDVDLIHLVE